MNLVTCNGDTPMKIESNIGKRLGKRLPSRVHQGMYMYIVDTQHKKMWDVVGRKLTRRTTNCSPIARKWQYQQQPSMRLRNKKHTRNRSSRQV